MPAGKQPELGDSLPRDDRRGLAVEVRGDASCPGVAVTLGLYNWRTMSWTSLEQPPDRTTSRVLAATVEPDQFVSPTGDVCLRLRAESATAFHTRTGPVVFSVEA